MSAYAQVIMPYHRVLDGLYERSQAIGTTKRGIGPCYMDRARRIGIQMGELVRPELFEKRLREVVKIKNQELSRIFGEKELDVEEVLGRYRELGDRLAEFVGPAEEKVGRALRGREKVLFEGAHGTLLDGTFGTYPFVTSCSTLAAGICAGMGVGPTRVGHVLGVIKAYTTRVGAGPLPTGLKDEEKFIGNVEAREIGSTTGRLRRMAWFDGVLARYAACLNGVDSLAIMKLDILDQLREIKVCTAYKLDGEVLTKPPAVTEDWDLVEPVYEIMEGWEKSTRDVKKYDDLPGNARKYVEKIEEICQTPVSLVSVGPEREQTVLIDAHPFS